MKIARRKPRSNEKTAVEPESPPVEDTMSSDSAMERPSLAADAEEEQAPADEQMPPETTQTSEEENDRVAALVAEIAEWRRLWCEKVSVEAQRTVAELHKDIAEAADKAKAEIAAAARTSRLSEQITSSEDAQVDSD